MADTTRRYFSRSPFKLVKGDDTLASLHRSRGNLRMKPYTGTGFSSFGRNKRGEHWTFIPDPNPQKQRMGNTTMASKLERAADNRSLKKAARRF